jgi:hypothetical protein
VKKQAKQLLVASLMGLYAALGAAAADESDDARLRHGYCDIVYYCQTTTRMNVFPDGTTQNLSNEAFRFAVKGSQLLVPEGKSVLGDGTANWDLTSGYCSQENPQELQFDSFEASLFGGSRFLKFDDNVIRFVDTTYRGTTRVWFATCDKFN